MKGLLRNLATVNPKKLDTGLRAISTGFPTGFPIHYS